MIPAVLYICVFLDRLTVALASSLLLHDSAKATRALRDMAWVSGFYSISVLLEKLNAYLLQSGL